MFRDSFGSSDSFRIADANRNSNNAAFLDGPLSAVACSGFGCSVRHSTFTTFKLSIPDYSRLPIQAGQHNLRLSHNARRAHAETALAGQAASDCHYRKRRRPCGNRAEASGSGDEADRGGHVPRLLPRNRADAGNRTGDRAQLPAGAPEAHSRLGGRDDVRAINEPQSVACGAPDFIVERRGRQDRPYRVQGCRLPTWTAPKPLRN